ncbi:MAG: type III PLP-dependent enzyme [Candidatus Pacearchaeota archaeon]|nr:type III PLP-dependent enzyme [Candidatus Pacearchaeota archaeon]
MEEKTILKLIREHGTERALFIIDHAKIRENYQRFTKNLPRVQVYYAIKSNSEQVILRTLFDKGASFDTASLHEFSQILKLLEKMDEKERVSFIYDKVIFSNTIKSVETLQSTMPYQPLMTFDNLYELKKIKKHCNTAGVILRVKVPDVDSMTPMASKFGAAPEEAENLIKQAKKMGLHVEGISFHVGSQCINFQNYVNALSISHKIFQSAEKNGWKIGRRDNGKKIIDLGGGFPASYTPDVPKFEKLAEIINKNLNEFFPSYKFEVIAEPGRFMVADTATLIVKIIGKSTRNGKLFYHINDGLYHTLSGIPFDHIHYQFKTFEKDKNKGPETACTIAGQTCDSIDVVPYDVMLPSDLEPEDLLIVDNVGAYTLASSTHFNGFPGAKVININQ